MTTADLEAKLFLRLAHDSEFKHWLALEEAKEVGALVAQTDPVRIYQSQGKVQFLHALAKKMQQVRDRVS